MALVQLDKIHIALVILFCKILHCFGDFFLARFYIGTFLMVIERNSFGPARQSSHCIGDFILQDFTLAHFQ